MALATVFAALAVVVTLVAFAYEPFVFVLAALFGAVAYFMWYQASGQLTRRLYRTVENQARKNDGHNERRVGGFGAGPRPEWTPRSEWARRVGFTGDGRRDNRTHERERADRRGTTSETLTTAEAYDILDLDPGVGDSAVKQAYREKVKDVHPDTDSGSQEAFKRVNEAYEHLMN